MPHPINFAEAFKIRNPLNMISAYKLFTKTAMLFVINIYCHYPHEAFITMLIVGWCQSQILFLFDPCKQGCQEQCIF